MPRLAVAVVLLLGLVAGMAGAVHAATVELVRDHYGMPHIFSASEAAGMYVFGQVQAEDRLAALLRNYKEARGELAEIDGPSALPGDIQVRAFRLGEIAKQKYATLSPEVREDLAAFCSGVNDYEKTHPKACPSWSFAVDPVDVVTFAEFVNLSFANGPSEQVAGSSSAWIPGELIHSRHRASDAALMGSNAFAIAPPRTSSGRGAILSMDPHLPWNGFLRWYEAHLACGSLNVSGVTFAGLPFIAMGHNAHVAWANTVNQPDLSDLFEEHLTPSSDPTGYVYDGVTRPLQRETFHFKVLGAVGQMSGQDHTVVYTPHGPVLVNDAGHRYAVCKAGWGDIRMLDQLRDQDLARSVGEYRKAIAGCHVVMFNHVVADDAGRIGYIYGGSIPRRPSGYDYRRPVPGWTSATDWLPDLRIEDLPQMYDPPSGVLANCNDAPYYVGNGKLTSGYGSAGYPIWLTDDVQTDRGRRMRSLLSTDGRISPDRAKAIATDTTDLVALQALPRLLNAVRQSAALRDGTNATVLAQCVDLLTHWDMRRDTADCGAALFAAWIWQPAVRALLGLPDPADAKVDPDAMANALIDAERTLQTQHSGLKTTWGDIHRHRRGTADLPMDGGGDSIVPNNGPADNNGVVTANFGPSYQMVVAFGDGPPRAWSYLPYGESDDPASPHYTDQMPLAAQCRFRSVPFTRADVAASASQTQEFNLAQY